MCLQRFHSAVDVVLLHFFMRNSAGIRCCVLRLTLWCYRAGGEGHPAAIQCCLRCAILPSPEKFFIMLYCVQETA